ncbi:MAG: tRNA (N6-isopentenyl adenosine(37)-C2)-methylthiotransferase MiaB [Fimbriimonadaceae bacterium]
MATVTSPDAQETLLRPEALARAKRPRAARGTFWVQTWGCQMNAEDSEQLELHLAGMGLTRAPAIGQAQVILLNTCSVRKKPEDKAFSMLGELVPVKETRPDVVIGVCGCMAQARAAEIHRRAPHVDFVLGTGDIGQVCGLVEDALQAKRFQMRVALPPRVRAVVEDVPTRKIGRAPKLKAFVPIQYGCDKFCTFCIVPHTRGRERSRPVPDIVDEVAALAAAGAREVTLLGQTVNSYGKNLAAGRVPFSKLLWLLAEVPELARIRYTSPYPRDFKADVIAAIRDCPKVMEHCHMPIQSGHDDVLRRMHRLYSVEGFLKIVADLRDAVPGVGLTTDIIVGFPGETDAEFEATLEIVRHVRFDGAYCFAYSIRPDTPAADMPQVPHPVKMERLNRLIAMQNAITCEINAAMVGREVEVLVEGPSPKRPDRLQGYSREFKMVHFAGSAERTGRIARVRVTGGHLWGLSGDLV